MCHPEDKVFIIHVSEMTHSGSIGKSNQAIIHSDQTCSCKCQLGML